MRSPFPGMDPYIESVSLWDDFHFRLIGEIEREIAKNLPDRYVARLGVRHYLVLEKENHPIQSSSARERSLYSQHRESFVQIFSLAPERSLITTIEVLCPSNKQPRTNGWNLYERMRREHQRGRANLVEIDLLRSGSRMPLRTKWPTDDPYYFIIMQKDHRRLLLWPAHFTRQLTVIPVPLASPDSDVALAMQPLVDSVYEISRYASDIDYYQQCNPPLSAAESAWLKERPRERKFLG